MRSNFAREQAKRLYFVSARALKVLLLRSIVLPVRLLTKGLYLSFDSRTAVDGTGAQLQRLISVAALSNYFRFKFVPSKIEHFSVHALDPFQGESSYRDQLLRLNQFINFPDADLGDEELELESVIIRSLTIKRFISVIVRQLISPKPRKLVVLEVYPVSEFCPGIFDNFKCELSEALDAVDEEKGSHLVIHYRQGVGGNVIYPGQKIPRQIEFSRILDFIQKLSGRREFDSISQITILTDAPDSVSFYTPPQSQRALWEGTPGFSDGVMTIQPMDFSELGKITEIPINVIRGGNPLDAIRIMATADFFVMSKSSLSYVGALLNSNGRIYFPSSFWHRPLKSWSKYDG